jgi:hypothetical protein
MSLPSGLIFFMDFTYSNTHSGLTGAGAQSLYGGGVVAKGIQTGVTDITEDGGGFYNLANHYSSPTGSTAVVGSMVSIADPGALSAGAIGIPTLFPAGGTAISALSVAQKKALRFDPDVLASTSTYEVYSAAYHFLAAKWLEVNENALGSMMLTTAINDGIEDDAGLSAGTLLRRLTENGYRNSTGEIVKLGHADHVAGENYVTFYWIQEGSDDALAIGGSEGISFALVDDFTTGGATGAVVGQDAWGLEGANNTAGAGFNGMSTDIIPEIDIKVDSVAVTAITKKLKAKWSPELGQDLNAYHNLDAEVELTSILSEQIALEIDREIVNDLIQGATAGTYYWSRSPGLFVNRTTGAELGAASAAPDFTGTVSEWYETLIETINDVSAQIHRKTLRGGANFLVTSPEVANILEFTAGFRASVTADEDRGTVGAVKVGSMSKKWDVYVDPYFPRNLVLVGRKGGSFLESGYVYAPYVPLQVTPTIFGTEDFVPRKGVMTRYAKKMVRPDMYGLVVVRGLLGEEGAS